MKTTRSSRLAILGAIAAGLLAPYGADSGTCGDPAARDLLAASYATTMLNGPKGEDTNFFTKAGGVPNIMVLLDTTGSMNRLPADGPSYYGAKLPPGYYMGSNENDSTTQDKAYAANDASTTTTPQYTDTCLQLATDSCTSDGDCCSGDCASGRCVPADPRWVSPATNMRIVGCGLDPVSAGNADFTGSAMYQALMGRRFYPPCGNAVDPSLVGAEYQGQATDYGDQMKVCPYFTSSDNQAVGAPGFDPDYYYPTDPLMTVSGGKFNFFGKSLIFHDNPDMNANWTRNTGRAFGHNFGGGFYYNGLSPHLDVSTGAKSSIASFCDQQALGTTQVQGGRSHADICNECLTQRGWYYDGTYFNAGENNAPTPSVWYTGNYLNFFPPKFLIARKVLKDIIAVQSRIRMAMATFTNGATFIQPFNPSCGMPDTSSFDSNRAAYVSGLGDVAFSGGTYMAKALFDVGRYYHSPDLPWFGTTWENSKLESSATANQYAVCYACQTSSVILITDGQPTSGDGDSLPSSLASVGLTEADLASNKKAGDPSTGIRGITKAVCPECDAFSDTSSSAYKDNLAKVAFYMQNMDLRKDTETTLDCKGNGGKQVLDTYTIGFATKGIPSVNTLLANAAKAGGGIFVPAENTQALKEGFNAIIEEINGRSTSFSVASVSTLQTMSGSAVHVPRFSPAKTAIWPGHLFRYDLYSEFVQGCTPNGAGDFNCDGQCTGVYLRDKDGDFISEDANGAFVKNDPPKQVNCAQAPACGGVGCAVAGSAPAVPYWDAADAWDTLSPRKWSARNVWTVVDRDVDGDLEANDLMVKFEATDASAKAIMPYLALGGGAVCAQVGARFATAGDLAASALVTTSASAQLECTKALIRYVLGADLFNENGSAAYPPSSPDQYEDRAFLLGDIFHSSPNRVVAPLPSTSDICKQGAERQCLISLWDTETKNGLAAYDEFQKTPTYRDRRRIVLVGADDGMLHAFDDGPFVDAVSDWPVQDVTQELWAFIPPDLIPKLPLLLGAEHHLFVDGTAMVRDVWVDGTGNSLGSGTRNDVKEAEEFHTVAVVGERRGGTRYFALDITDATEPKSVPRFLWLYPQPGAKESLTFGETYNDVLPTAPPIGPVRVATGSGTYPTFADSPPYTYDGSNTPFHETWVALLSGGYDPQYVRGRGVHMVDVWTGREIWDFSYPANPASVSSDDPRLALRYPIPAVVGMVAWGVNEKLPDVTLPRDNYFDTATFGDAGGQLWTLRFHVPAKLDTNGLATNWFGARMFQMGGPTGCKLCSGQPFFYVTANAPTPADRVLRTYAGTGDRFALTENRGGTCGPFNLRACIMRGCTVTVTQASNLLSAPGPGYAQRGLSAVACNDLVNTQLDGGAASCTIDGKARIEITCPGGLVGTPKDTAVSCTELADGYTCTKTRDTKGSQLAPAGVPPVGNWFFSLRAFDGAAHPIFTTADEAKKYDAARYWITQNGAIRATSGIPLVDATGLTGSGTEDGPGWAMFYNLPATLPVEGVTATVDWRDEKTSSGTTIQGNVVSWNTVIPPLTVSENTATSSSCRVSQCTQGTDRRINFAYAADGVTGAALGFVFDNTPTLKRSTSSFRLVPAQALQTTYFVDKQGKVQKAMVGVSPEQGAMSIAASDPEDPVTEGGSLIIDKELYECRYADTPVCK